MIKLLLIFLLTLLCLQGCTPNDPFVTPESTEAEKSQLDCSSGYYECEFYSIEQLNDFLLSDNTDPDNYEQIPAISPKQTLDEFYAVSQTAVEYYIQLSELFAVDDSVKDLVESASLWVHTETHENVQYSFFFNESYEYYDSSSHTIKNMVEVIININRGKSFVDNDYTEYKSSKYKSYIDADSSAIYTMNLECGIYQIRIYAFSAIHDDPENTLQGLLDSKSKLNPITYLFSEDTETRNTALDKLVSTLENAQINTIE